MIRDLSLTLQALLANPPEPKADFSDLAAAHIVFDPPADTFNPTQTTIDSRETKPKEESKERLCPPLL